MSNDTGNSRIVKWLRMPIYTGKSRTVKRLGKAIFWVVGFFTLAGMACELLFVALGPRRRENTTWGIALLLGLGIAALMRCVESCSEALPETSHWKHFLEQRGPSRSVVTRLMLAILGTLAVSVILSKSAGTIYLIAFVLAFGKASSLPRGSGSSSQER